MSHGQTYIRDEDTIFKVECCGIDQQNQLQYTNDIQRKITPKNNVVQLKY